MATGKYKLQTNNDWNAIFYRFKQGKQFDIIVSTNSKKYSIIAKKYGAKVPFLRPNKFSRATSPDFLWVRYTINKLKSIGLEYVSLEFELHVPVQCRF